MSHIKNVLMLNKIVLVLEWRAGWRSPVSGRACDKGLVIPGDSRDPTH